jgi:hypothetical protein
LISLRLSLVSRTGRPVRAGTSMSYSGAATIPEATLVTNGAGNGEAGYTFVPAQAPPPGVYNLQWHVLNGVTAAYQTACSSVAID